MIVLVLRHKNIVAMETTVEELLDFCRTINIPEERAGGGFDAYVINPKGFRKFAEAFVQVADVVDEKGEGVALRKAGGVVKVLAGKNLLRPDTPARAFLDFCLAQRGQQRAVDVGADDATEVDDHAATPIDLTGQDPKLPPSFLNGNVKFKSILYAMSDEVNGEQRMDVLMKLAQSMKAFAQKEMRREGLGDGNQIDPRAIIEHYFGRGRKKTERESMDSNDPEFLVQREQVRKVDWVAFCKVYDFKADQASVLKDLGISAVKKGLTDKGVIGAANGLLAERKKARPKVNIKNGRHLIGAMMDAVIKKARSTPLSKVLTASQASELLGELAPS